MEEARLAYPLIWCFIGACFMFFGRYIILTMLAKEYCKCGHEYNEHNIVPAYYAPTGTTKYSDGTCKGCGCKKYTTNKEDRRNTPPIKFFPR